MCFFNGVYREIEGGVNRISPIIRAFSHKRSQRKKGVGCIKHKRSKRKKGVGVQRDKEEEEEANKLKY